MNVAISIADHEREMAHRWFSWVSELGGTDGHSLYLIPAASVNISDILPKAEKAFVGRVNVIKDDEGQTSNWQITEPMRSASGPNSAFRQVAWHFYLNKLGPWFWCELDCIPTRKDWLDKLEAEYKVGLSKGKPFTGGRVLLESVPEHLTGNSVYPWNVPEESPTIVMRTNWTPRDQERSFELAFDIAGAKEVVPKSHFTNLVQHKFRYEGFRSREQFDAVIDKNAVVFHSDKSGSILPYLRQNLSGNQGGDAKCNTTSTVNAGTASSPRDEDRACNAAPIVQSVGAAATVESRTFKPELESVIKQNAVIKNGLPAMSPPWENREDTERDVKMLCEALALFAKAPLYKSRVRQALREAKIIK